MVQRAYVVRGSLKDPAPVLKPVLGNEESEDHVSVLLASTEESNIPTHIDILNFDRVVPTRECMALTLAIILNCC